MLTLIPPTDEIDLDTAEAIARVFRTARTHRAVVLVRQPLFGAPQVELRLPPGREGERPSIRAALEAAIRGEEERGAHPPTDPRNTTPRPNGDAGEPIPRPVESEATVGEGA